MKIEIPLEFGREPGQDSWVLPPWGHAISLGVYPLLTGARGILELVGTAFSFSNIGFVGTALHSILEVCKAEGIPLPDLRASGERRQPEIRLRNATLAVLHHTVSEDNSINATIRPLQTVDAFPPSEIAIAFPRFQTDLPFFSLPLSFDVPRVGSVVKCIGYTSAGAGTHKIDLAAFEDGGVSVPITYEHTLQVTEARVTDIFVRQFASRFVEGPCFAIDAELPHGMSGGPVLNEAGFVCGVVAAGASTFFARPASLVSMLYPIALGTVRFGATMGPITVNAKRTFADLAVTKAIATDGSEMRLAFSGDHELGGVCPLIAKADSRSVHDDFASMQAGTGGTRATGKFFRIALPQAETE